MLQAQYHSKILNPHYKREMYLILYHFKIWRKKSA